MALKPDRLAGASWSGPATISGTCSLSSGPLQEGAAASAVVTADNGTAWLPASAAFGTVPPACGPITATAAVLPLTPWIIAGNLTLGLALALRLTNTDNSFDSLVLPASLELNLRHDLSGATPGPVAAPSPLPLLGATTAFGCARRLRLRQRHCQRQPIRRRS